MLNLVTNLPIKKESNSFLTLLRGGNGKEKKKKKKKIQNKKLNYPSQIKIPNSDDSEHLLFISFETKTAEIVFVCMYTHMCIF